MEKRMLLALGISGAILVVWYMLFPPKPETPPAPPPQAQVAPPVAPTGAPPAAPGAAAPGTPAAPGQPPTGAQRPAEEKTTIERAALWRATFTTWGAAPTEFVLLSPRYKETIWAPKADYAAHLPAGTVPVRSGDSDPNFEKREVQIDLVRRNAGALPFLLSFPDSDVALPDGAAWQLVAKSDRELTYAVDVGALHLTKKWTLPTDGYALGLDVTVENRGDKPVTQHLQIGVTGWQDPAVKPGGFLSLGRRYNLTNALCFAGGKLKGEGLEKLEKEPLVEQGDVRWVGVGEQFFLAAAALQPAPTETRKCGETADALGRFLTTAYFGERRIAPGQNAQYPMTVYLGPKQVSALDAVRVAGQDPSLGRAVDYTLEFVARPMLLLLKGIQKVTVNWGIAIIVFTILLKALLFYPTQRSMKSMRGMAALKPEMDRLKEKYPEDKNRQNQEVMALYKKHGINPLGGCLPMLIQMPIYIAFYSMLSNAVELYHARLVGPIDDMTAPFWPLAAVTGVLMFVQQRISPQSPDSQQQKMMMYTMPIMFAAFTIFLPSGLTLYIFTNTLLTMAQQWWFNRSNPLPTAPAPKAKPARA